VVVKVKVVVKTCKNRGHILLP